ncbi:MAG: hypothetical protein NC452_02070 [Eubacterium sp.]|nr:hypothetical protein [Eubacterium sp.]
MIEDLLKAVRKAVLFAALPAAGLVLAAAYLSGKPHVRTKDSDERIYRLGKKSNHKAVYITNISPADFVLNAVKRCFKG